MNTAQQNAFTEGTGGFFTAPALLTAIQGIGATVVFTYIAWLCYLAYADYGKGSINSTTLIMLWLRNVFALMVILYLLLE